MSLLKSILNGLVVLALVSVSAVYMKCNLCKTGIEAPAFSILNKIDGIYAPVYGKHIPYGGILTKGHINPMACGFLDESLLGQNATGWVDQQGALYQLEVGHITICSYEETTNNMLKTKKKFYFLTILLFVICLLRIFTTSFHSKVKQA